MQVRKAVIPAAGWGTRFLPLTKAEPKEMLPLLNKPLIQYAVEEAVECGIKDIVIVIAPGKQLLSDYFASSAELRATLIQKGEPSLAAELERLENLADISYVTQTERRGLGHAVLMAQSQIGDEPFAIILPDDIVDSREPALEQMLKVFEQYKSSVIAVESIDGQDSRKYGIIRADRLSERVYQVTRLVEKPAPEVAPSHLGIVGRYILTPRIFEALGQTKPGSGGEIQLTDALNLLLSSQCIYALELEGKRYDTGNPLGWLEAQVAFGLKHPEMGDALREKLRKLV
jgi:UTP--glucose-1-phosphate uridylyltransferase